jgi:predicted SAM-dependent methyltransferase
LSTFKTPYTALLPRRAATRSLKKALKALRKDAELGLHLGAGGRRIEHMVNCDLFDRAADRKVDAGRLSAFEDASVDIIEHHHMIEHLSFADLPPAMAEWVRVLKPGGHLVISCPDILRVCARYMWLRLKSAVSDQSAELDYAIAMFVGSQEHDGMFHKNQFDAPRLEALMQEYGLHIRYLGKYGTRKTPTILVVAQKSET